MVNYTEIIAAAWREIGQPDITGLTFIVDLASELGEDCGNYIIGIPVLWTYLPNEPIILVSNDPNWDHTISMRFENKIRGLLK